MINPSARCPSATNSSNLVARPVTICVWTPLLKHQSKRLTHRTVTAVLEEPAGITSAHRRERFAHSLYERLAGARLGSTHESLDLAERLLDGVQVRRVGRQVQQLASPPLEEFPDPSSLVGGEVGHDHDLSLTEVRG